MIFLHWLKWIWDGKPVIYYSGSHCGCCGNVIVGSFTIPAYLSNGTWADTWGLCEKCAKAK